MNATELKGLLAELRAIRTDHHAVEAKRARRGLPESTHETLSAFANSEGGLLLLGVDETEGAFVVTGVADVRQAQADLQAACALMDPPLRPTIDLVSHPDGMVLSAYIPPVPREHRPCHLARDPAEVSSFVRVGDGDQRLTAAEVADLLAGRAGRDYSAAPAPDGARLEPEATARFAAVVADLYERSRGMGEDLILDRWGVQTPAPDVVSGGGSRPTLAGVLTLGEAPARTCPAARLTYRRLPRAGDPPGTRYSGRHLEGTIGELLDDTLAAVRKDLVMVQVVRGDQLVDALDVPVEALRELVSNALVHRSFAEGQRESSVLVEVSDEAVLITSPGSLHVSADPATLGLAPIAGVRNLTLVRIAELMRTPSGGRIVEHQTSGIAAADRACHAEQTMPALFVDRPGHFQAALLRGALDTRDARARMTAAGVVATEARLRLLAVCGRLEQLRAEIVAPGLTSVVFDARLAARALAPCSVEDAAAELRALEDASVLRRVRARRVPSWTLPLEPPERAGAVRPEPGAVRPEPGAVQASRVANASGHGSAADAGRHSRSRVPELLAAIEAAGGVLTSRDIGVALGLSSPTSRTRWIRRAVEAGLIVSTVENPFDPTGGYQLTAAGQGVLRRERRP